MRYLFYYGLAILFLTSCSENYNLSQTFSYYCLELNYPNDWKIIEAVPDTVNSYLPTYQLYNPNLKIAKGKTYDEDSLIIIQPLCLPIKTQDQNISAEEALQENCKTCKVLYTNSIPYIRIDGDINISWITVKPNKNVAAFIEFRIKKENEKLFSEDVIKSIIETVNVK